MARKRWPSWSVKDSCAPGCGRSRRTITRVPSGQPVRSSAVGDLGDPGALAGLAVLADRGPPGRFGQAEDRRADRLGEVEAHQEADARGAQLVGELVRGGGAVGADHDLR